MPPGELVAVVVAAITGIGGLATAVFTKRKIDADAGNQIVQSAADTVALVTDQMQRMKAQAEQMEWHISKLEQDLATYKAKLRKAEARIRRLEDFIRLNTSFDPEDINGEPI